MKYLKKKKKSRLVPVLCLLSLLLALLIAFVIVMELQKQNSQPAEESHPWTQETTAPATQAATVPATQATEEAVEYVPAEPVEPLAESELIELETPYCSIYFPKLWDDYLHINPVEGDSYCMEFGCRIEDDRVYRLFDISFDSGNGTLLGSVAANDGSQVEVYLMLYDPEESMRDEEKETFLAMQEDVNQLIAKLLTVSSDEPEDILIQTPFCQLTYPGQWEEYLQVEHAGGKNYVVNFYAAFDGMEKIHLFAVKFGTDTEGALMVITDDDGNEVGVRMDMQEIPDQGMTDEQLNTVHAMQEAVNDLLGALAGNEE